MPKPIAPGDIASAVDEHNAPPDPSPPLIHPTADDKSLRGRIVSTATSTTTPAAADIGYDRTEPRMSAVGLWGLAIIVVLIGVIAGVQAVFDRVYERQVYRRVLDPVAETLIDVRSRERNRLHSYQYLDAAGQSVRLPIDRAMELISAEAAEGRFPYSTSPVPVKIEAEPEGALSGEENRAAAAKP